MFKWIAFFIVGFIVICWFNFGFPDIVVKILLFLVIGLVVNIVIYLVTEKIKKQR